ncbi:glycoside hydrolase family 18 protein [Amycolatopsis cihanbeyliensis]|uniref:Glycosyl hydrolase family 18 (Putative chitinase) n=1 Tax=Amycolatopsis cihanbeyliensis TaxID=1128664 RepID=A0A542DQV5_AMYCI|nr:cellulose binding domain-containing protein [Amycolatopsis cihanbeyliensis]TQJ05488.1 glycosyl hydrolase family 18 (putative chitinase) [Amycolatopsis cihanbeyliensis]
MSKTRKLLVLFTATAAALLGLSAVPASAAPGLTATFTTVSDWGTGFEGKVTVSNDSETALDGWTVEFDLPAGYSINSSWNAQRTGSGQHYTFRNPSWAPTLGAGSSTSFGFNGAPGGISEILNCTLNGDPCDGGGGPGEPGAPGVPGTPSVTGTSNSSISLSWNASSGTVSGYRVYEGASPRATTSGTSTTISGLGDCTTHSYTVVAYNDSGESGRSDSVTATTGGCTQPAGIGAAPYLYLGWGNPPSATMVMEETGIEAFTMAFILSDGGCSPAWDSNRPLQGSVDARTIANVQAAGGQIVPSIGGWSGNKLGPNCSTPEALAGAYQEVIDAYGLNAIDIDIENTDEFEDPTVQDRILNALRIVEQNNPGIETIVTFPTLRSGPNYWGNRLIERAQELQVGIDVFTIMPFNFSGSDMYQDTVGASEGLKNKLKSTFGWSDATAYGHMGISGMNGLSDQRELTSLSDWTQIRDWARGNGLARLAYWAVNRDRPCPNGGVSSNCSGISQPDWEFTRITAGF